MKILRNNFFLHKATKDTKQTKSLRPLRETNKMLNKLKNKQAKLAVIGLGYVGLPVALEMAKKISVIGFDQCRKNCINATRY